MRSGVAATRLERTVFATAIPGTVTSRTSLSIRAQPATRSAQLGSYASGARISVSCRTVGEIVDGDPFWYQLANRSGWVAARYVSVSGPVPSCDDPGPQGPQGAQGATGATGPQGSTGANGLQGGIGATGPQGVGGPAGQKGDSGGMGPQGATGAMGPQGGTGGTGPQGVTGANGPQGGIGATGPQG
ncbi:SH3 domain-containing protein, partial [Streptomyces sp. NPDC127105]|uniref:SH3 domain-containing protein n=1 Tax=Streptomyces sp. NPDC127105 TaxID=3345359 RepID=UPI0036505556